MSTLPTVRTYMDPEHHAVREQDPILDAIRVLIREGITGAPVVDEQGKVTGILTEFECLRILTKGDPMADIPRGKVVDYMKRDLQTVKPDMDIYYVAGLFLASGFRRFVVLEGDRLVGVITRKDILKVVERNFPDE